MTTSDHDHPLTQFADLITARRASFEDECDVYKLADIGLTIAENLFDKGVTPDELAHFYLIAMRIGWCNSESLHAALKSEAG